MMPRTPIAATVQSAFAWWVRELTACVPERLRRRGKPRLIVDEDGLYVTDESGRRFEPRSGLDGMGVIVRLPVERALRSVVTLPIAAERNLVQVMDFEFERLTPFRREDVHYAHRVLARDDRTRRLQIELAVVPRSAMRDITRFSEQFGLRPVGIEIAAPDGVFSLRCDVPEENARPAWQRIRRNALGTFAFLAVALVAAAVAIPLLQAEAEVRRLAVRVAEARREAAETTRLDQAIEIQRRESQILTERKRRTTPIVTLLDQLTRLVPDDAWVIELVITGKEARIAGLATSATGLLSALDQSGTFTSAAFRSPVTADPRLARERFDIAVQIAEQR